jgi:hypothetical protein
MNKVYTKLYLNTKVELGIFTHGENVKITSYHRPKIKYSSREFFSNN